MPDVSPRTKSHLNRLLPNLAGLFLVAFGSFTLGWVGQLTWYDMTVWGKDIVRIFFGSRTGENISLGIGMKVIHYFLIGLALLLPGLLTLLRRGIKPIKLLLSRPKRVQPQKEKEETKRKEKPVVKPLVEEDVYALEEKIFSGCLHHFGYLASRPKNTPIPQECILCQRLGDCMVATVFTDKEKRGKIRLRL